MKPAPFDYFAPTTIAEAVGVLSEAGGGATVLAGGQTLMPLLALRMSQPFILVDINRIGALAGISRTPESTRIGATTRQNHALADPDLAAVQPVLVKALSHVGHYQTRNRGTIGGSLALGEPAAELPATAVALGAEFEVHSVRGERRIPADEFYLGPYMTALEPDELLTAVHFPNWPGGTATIFHEVARRPGDFALVGLVGAVHVAEGRIARAGLAWFGMGPTPMKARQVEATLVGQSIAAIDIAAMAELGLADADPFEGSGATANYRRTVGRRVFAKALSQAISERATA